MSDDLTIDRPTWEFVLEYLESHEVVIEGWGAATSGGAARETNEDSWANKGERVFVVADGMGGLDRGDMAAETTVEMFTKGDESPDWEQLATSATMSLRAAVLREGLRGCGAAFVACEIDRGVLTVANLGDARCYLLRSGQLEMLSEDHTLEAELSADGLDELLATVTARQRRSLTRYVGAEGAKTLPSISSVSLRDQDRILLCTDGVYRELDETKMTELMAITDPAGAAIGLVQAVKQAEGPDDATALCLSFVESS